MKPAREPASACPKPQTTMKNAPIISRSPLLVGYRRKKLLREQFFPPKNLPVCDFDSRTQDSSTPWLVDDRAALRPRQIICLLARYIVPRYVFLGVLQSPTRLSTTTVLPASRVPPPPEGHQIRARKKRTE